MSPSGEEPAVAEQGIERGVESPTQRAKPTAPRRRRLRWRPLIRSLHRDFGYFVVGLTFIYALSGLAVNHINDWDPSFTQIEREHQLELPLPAGDDALAQHVLERLAISEEPSDVYRASDEQFEISLEKTSLHINTKTGVVFEEGQEPRFLLRAMNWLHLNRGKQAWTYVADAYAIILLYLATSGLFMIPGKKGLLGRGAILAAAGAAIPVLYVLLSGP